VSVDEGVERRPVEDALLLGAGGGGGGGGRLPATLDSRQNVAHTHLMVVGLVIGAAFIFLMGMGFGEYWAQRRTY
jgi:hypothetical protein